ncbi:MAG: nucleotidyltransferase substrate binding protein [Epsilonproteobacteria bacterium]|nr:nucleotidyltransferase substrate binding protein [Campylobacterota bacterium]
MERLNKRHKTLTKALTTLLKSIDRITNNEYNDYEEARDSLIQRFEYTSDIFWKYLHDYLKTMHNIKLDIVSPKSVYKAFRDTNIITEEEFTLCIRQVELRNLTSHTYDEELAEEVCKQIPTLARMMKTVTSRLAKNAPD